MIHSPNLAVVPVLIGPLQILITVLPGLILAGLAALISLFKPRAMLTGLRVLWRQKIQVAILAVAVFGLVRGGEWAWDRYGPRAAAAAAVQGTDWPTARGSVQRVGAVPGAEAPTRGGIQWSYFASERESFFSSATVVGNRVYISSANMGVFNKSGKIYCFDADTGAKVWELAPEGYRPTFSSPVVAGHYLVCGEGLHDCNDARVVCVDLSDEQNPRILWTHTTANHVECTPAIYKDRVVVNTGDDGVYCLALEPGPNGAAKVLWHAPGGKYLDCETSLAVDDGKVYVGMGLDGNGLVVFDIENGKELRRFDAGAPVFSPPAIADGKLYFVAGFGDYVFNWKIATDNLVAKWVKQGKPAEEIEAWKAKMGPQGTVYCIDLASWKVDWTYATRETALGAVAVAGDQLYVGTRDGRVSCLSREGKLVAEWESHAPILTSPAVTARHVCVVNSDGMLYVIDRANMGRGWQFRLGPGGEGTNFLSSPTVARGHVYVGTDKDGFLCVGEPGTEAVTPLWASSMGGAGRAGNTDGSAIAPAMTVVGSVPLTARWEPFAGGRAPFAVLSNRVYAAIEGGSHAGLLCLEVAEKRVSTVWEVPISAGIQGSPVACNDRIWCVEGKPGSVGRLLHALDSSSGKPIWSAPVTPRASGILLATKDHLLVQDDEQELSCFIHEGRRQWSQKVGRLAAPPTLTGSMLVAATVQPPTLAALDLQTGALLWRRAIEIPATCSPFIQKDRILVGTFVGLQAYSLLDGMPIPNWQSNGGGVSADFAVAGQVAVYVNQEHELVTVNLANGSLRGKSPGALAGFAPLVSRSAVVVVTKKGLDRASLQDPALDLQPWIDLTDLGQARSNLVLVDGRIWLTTGRGGVVLLGPG